MGEPRRARESKGATAITRDASPEAQAAPKPTPISLLIGPILVLLLGVVDRMAGPPPARLAKRGGRGREGRQGRALRPAPAVPTPVGVPCVIRTAIPAIAPVAAQAPDGARPAHGALANEA